MDQTLINPETTYPCTIKTLTVLLPLWYSKLETRKQALVKIHDYFITLIEINIYKTTIHRIASSRNKVHSTQETMKLENFETIDSF